MPDRKQVEALIAAMRLAVIDLLHDLLDRSQAIADLVKLTKLDDWDFFATVAGVGAGLLEFPGEKSRTTSSALSSVATDALNQWDAQGGEALADFMKFVRESVESGIDAQTAIGGWLLWNVKSEQPSDSELDSAPGIGLFLRAAAKGCWPPD